MVETTKVALTITSGPWDAGQVSDFLHQTVIPIRLGSLRIDEQGRPSPVVQSLWFAYRDEALWCATQAAAALVARLRRDAAVGFEICGDVPPYRGVRGSGRAEVIPEAEDVLRELISRYGQQGTPLADWLLGRLASEVAIRISDLRISTWDYSARMAR